MNLALISHLFPNSVHPLRGTFVMEKAQALARLVPLKVCAPVAWAPLLRKRPPARETVGNLEVFHPVYPGLPGVLFRQRWRAYQAALHVFFREIPRPDALLVDWVYPDAYAVMAYCHGMGLPTVITTHGANAIGYYSRAGRLPYYAAPLREADRIVAVSADLKRKIMAVAGVSSDKIHVVPNGVDTDIFTSYSRIQARAELGFPPQTPLIVCVARLAPEKALHLLLQAVNHVHAAQAQLCIIGEGPLRRRLGMLTRRLKLVNRVRFMGGLPRQDVARWLVAADVCALSSLHEGDPVVIREALACGTPVVAPRVGGIQEAVVGKQYGLLCDPNDSLQLAHHLDEALKRTWDRIQISRYGREYSWDNIAGKLMDTVLSEVL